MNITHKTDEFKALNFINAITKTEMKHARGQKNFFQKASLLMCLCNFAIGYLLNLKTQSVNMFLY